MASDQKGYSDNSVRRFIGKWTGISYIRKKYRTWRARRTVGVSGSGNVAVDANVSCNLYKNDTFPCQYKHASVAEMTVESSAWRPHSLYNTLVDDELQNYQSDHVHLSNSHLVLSDGELLKKLLVASESPIPRAVSEASVGQYIFQRLLGAGSFSKVKLAVDRRTGGAVAVKMMDIDEVRQSARLQETLSREIEILQRIRHPNIVQFREATLMKGTICIVMDYVPGQELFQYVARKKRLDEEETAKILREVLVAIKYLHQNNIVHRDLKLENILVEDRVGRIKVTLVDFGLARLTRNYPLMTRCGSEEYAAPEVIMGEPYDGCLSDAWSFGVIMYACLIGSLPFNPESGKSRALAEKIVSVNYRVPDEHISSTAAHIIRSLLVREPNRRLTIEELLRHTFFAI
jgi:serine/threonine protein kinase